jgi:hypothetical protein
MFNNVRYEGFAEMGKNPASVEMGTKDLILNKDTFPRLPKFTQKFIVEHEKGHLLYDTDSEELADAHALQSLYKTERKSLKKSIKALVDFLPENDPRIETLYNKALEIDKGENNMAKFNMNSFLAGTQPNGLRTFRRHADGDEDANEDSIIIDGQTGRKHKRFVKFLGFKMTPAEIAVLIVSCIVILKHLK